MSIDKVIDQKAGLFHWVLAGLTIVGLIVLYNYVTGTQAASPTSQAGFDVTAMAVLGG
jgi:hypothetical protein